jgi:hypothetical protein
MNGKVNKIAVDVVVVVSWIHGALREGLRAGV